jgi:hypothetical protein
MKRKALQHQPLNRNRDSPETSILKVLPKKSQDGFIPCRLQHIPLRTNNGMHENVTHAYRIDGGRISRSRQSCSIKRPSRCARICTAFWIKCESLANPDGSGMNCQVLIYGPMLFVSIRRHLGKWSSDYADGQHLRVSRQSLHMARLWKSLYRLATAITCAQSYETLQKVSLVGSPLTKPSWGPFSPTSPLLNGFGLLRVFLTLTKIEPTFVGKLIDNDYWSRAWICQEHIFAKDRIVLYGAVSVGWRHFEECCLRLNKWQDTSITLPHLSPFNYTRADQFLCM